LIRTIAWSDAFMLPVGTGAHSVIFTSGRITIPTMAGCGGWLNLIGVVLMAQTMDLIAIPVFEISATLPAGAK
jgi:di/tricarboxylate transporter